MSDLSRYSDGLSVRSFFKNFIFTPGFRYTSIMRLCGYLKTKPLFAFGLYPAFKLLLLRYRYKFGIAIPEYTVIGPGLLINRFGGIYIGGDAVIGCNVNVTHGVLLGYTNRGPKAGCPVIGSRTFLGAGAKVIGQIIVGADAAIGANAVVTKDVPARGVVGGIPAKLISENGSVGYINRHVPAWLMAKCADPFMDSSVKLP
jgi:serine O-acetyltransferase